MRLFELFQIDEAREYLDTINDYGSWIDTNASGEDYGWPIEMYGDIAIIPIHNKFEHTKYSADRFGLDEPNDDDEFGDIVKFDDEKDPYALAYNNNLVRVTYSRDHLNVEGKIDAIKKAWKLIRPSVFKPEIKEIFIDIVGPPRSWHYLKLPDEKNKLIQIMR